MTEEKTNSSGDSAPGAAKPREGFASRVGFVLSAAGSAIGLGNIWRFPYMTGENGGAAFVLMYVCFVLMLGFPVMMAEFAVGQAARKSSVMAFSELAPGTRWNWIGRMGLATGFAILAFYSAVAGWALGYFGKSLGGDFSSPVTPEASGRLFTEFTSSPVMSIAAAVLVVVVSALVVYKGVTKGIERAALVLMPAFFILLVILAVYSLRLPGAFEGVKYLFKPDFSKLDLSVAMAALGQSFFSLSIGLGVMITYSSYLDRKEHSLAPMALSSIGADTGVAILAGLIIFPAIFAVGAQPSGGPGLAFITLPTIFSGLPAGSVISAAFYALLLIAALTSTVSIFELVAADLVDRKGWKRRQAVLLISAVSLVLSVPCALSFGGSDFFTKFFGVPDGFFGLLNIAFGNITMILGGLLTCVFVGWKWGMPRALEALGIPPGSLTARLLGISIRWVCPVAITSILAFIVFTGKFF